MLDARESSEYLVVDGMSWACTLDGGASGYETVTFGEPPDHDRKASTAGLQEDRVDQGIQGPAGEEVRRASEIG